MSLVTIDDTNLMNIADAIREKSGTNNIYKPSEMASAIQSISASEDLSSELNTQDTLLNNQTNKLNVAINTLKNKASGGADSLEIARSIIDKTITSYNDDQLTEIGTYLFYNCSKFTELNAPNVVEIGGYAFQGSKVKTMYFPKLTHAVANAFRNAKSIETLDLPSCTKIDNASAHSCTALKTVNFPKAVELVRACMSGCSSLAYIDLPACTEIGTQAFYNCTSLKTIILRSETLCVLAGTDAFYNCTSLENIYVPDNLVEEYKGATNWSAFASQIKSLSELEV